MHKHARLHYNHETVGGVVSIASLAIQLGDKVQQVHDFWHSFKQAPAEIQQILQDLDSFSDLLDAGPRSNSNYDPLVLQILQRCDEKIEILRTRVTKLEPGFRSQKAVIRQWSSFNVVLKRKIIEKSQTAIRDAKSDLVLANQIVAEYGNAQTQSLSR